MRPPTSVVSDRLIVLQGIQEIFARSPVFCDAMISEPFVGSEDDVAVDVSFERGSTAFRVVAPSEEEAYAVLHELATAMVELEQGGAGSGRLEAKAVSRESSRAGREVQGDNCAPQSACMRMWGQAALPTSE